MKTLVAIAALCLPAGAQTVAIPGMSVTIPARAVPAQTFTIDVPKGGGKMSITIPSQILPPQTSSTAPRTAPVSLGTITINFTCTGADMQHLSCQAAQQVARAAIPDSMDGVAWDAPRPVYGEVPCWRADQIAPCFAIVGPGKAAVPTRSPFADVLDHLRPCIGDCHIYQNILKKDRNVAQQ